MDPNQAPDPHGRDPRRGPRVLAAEQRTTASGTPDKRYGPRDPASSVALQTKINATRSVRRNLAAVIRETVDPEAITEWLLCVWLEGRIPPPPAERRRKGKNGEPIPDELVDSSFTPPTVGERMKCLEMLLLRGFGQPTTHVVLDAEVRALVQVDHDGARRRIADMPAHKRRALRELLQAVQRPAPAGAPMTDGMLPDDEPEDATSDPPSALLPAGDPEVPPAW
jgi:hypothetical protein